MQNPFSLEGRTILITGASSGIGQATAIECSKQGAKLIITARNREKLQETLSLLSGNDHKMVVADLCKPADIDKIVAETPLIEGLVNNAGFTQITPVHYIKEDGLSAIFQVNTFAPILLTQKLLRNKKITSGASVVFTSSLAGISTVTVGNSMYSASKGAISAFVRNAALELAPRKIRVNAVCPAMVNTGILSQETLSKDQLLEDMKNYPLKRYGEPEDIAYAIIYLLSGASSWVTGINLVIDGGITLK